MIEVSKGRIPFGDYETWYQVTGSPGGSSPAVVVLHGGPGSTHDYLRNVAGLAAAGWPVVHYDQLGNGGSTRLPEKSPEFWTPQLFADELDNLIERLGIAGNYVLFGHSWGGLLAARHGAERPPGLRGLVLANAPASYGLWRSEMEVLRAGLPPEVDAVLRRHEAAGTTSSPEYFEMMKVFYEKHVCRLKPWPSDYRASFLETADNPVVYAAMNGPSEFHVIGSLRDYSVIDRLAAIEVPTLLISGRHDEATPVTVRPFQEHIADVRWEIFEESSHVPHLEEPRRFFTVMIQYLARLIRREAPAEVGQR